MVPPAAERSGRRLQGGVGGPLGSTPGELANAIALQDNAVSRAPGVGPKVAVRIITELKNKAPAFAGEAAAISA